MGFLENIFHGQMILCVQQYIDDIFSDKGHPDAEIGEWLIAVSFFVHGFNPNILMKMIIIII
jgi:hypothetical protein